MGSSFVLFDVSMEITVGQCRSGKSGYTKKLWLHTPWIWGLMEAKWLGLGSAQVSCYPWGCGYTEKDTPQGKI